MKRTRNQTNGGGGDLLIDGFNESCNNIASIYLKFGNESMSVVFLGLQQRVTYLTCPIFYTIRNHWRRSSRLYPVISLGPCYSLIHKEGRK